MTVNCVEMAEEVGVAVMWDETDHVDFRVVQILPGF